MAAFNSMILIGAFMVLGSRIQLGTGAAQKAVDSAVLCYWGSWSTYRPGIGSFQVNNIDPTLCTHVVYAYAGLKNGVIASLDAYNDFEEAYGKGTMRKFTTYAENNGFKALLGVGGWNEGSAKYSEMASYAAGREDFADSAVAFLQEYGFHGLSLDWEYPTQRGGNPEDKENFVLLLQTLQEKFADNGFTLTIGVGVQPVFVTSYDMANIGKYVDYIIVQSYDYHTYVDGYTGVSAPLTAGNTNSVENSINEWLSAGAPAEKLIVGVAAYGRTDHLADADKHDLGDRVTGPGTAGSITQEAGLLTYLEFCTTKNWIIEHSDDPLYTYAYRGNQWISYDDADTLQVKGQYVKDNGLGGIMMYSLESDDFEGNCGTAYPLLTGINKGLGRL